MKSFPPSLSLSFACVEERPALPSIDPSRLPPLVPTPRDRAVEDGRGLTRALDPAMMARRLLPRLRPDALGGQPDLESPRVKINAGERFC